MGLTIGVLVAALIAYWRFGHGANPRLASTVFWALYLSALGLAARIGARLGRPSGADRVLSIATVVVVLTAMVTSMWFVEFLNACFISHTVLLDARC